MSLIKHKKVELTELFYDLVYVYGISKEVTLIHHAHEGGVSFQSFVTFAIGMIIMINSWMIQTVFTNRFGKNSLTNILFMFAQMSVLLISLTSVTGEMNRQHFMYFYVPFLIISVILFVQYLVEYMSSTRESDKKLIRRYFYIIGIRSLGLLVAVLLPMNIGLLVAGASVLGTWILPGILTRKGTEYAVFAKSLTSFPHMVERLSLLVIITFGETIIGISDYFSAEKLSLMSFLIFGIVAWLFIIYIVEVDHMIDLDTENNDINSLIYWHYPIFFGLSFVTVSLGFIGNPEVHKNFAIALMYAGIALFLLGVIGMQKFNKVNHHFTKQLTVGMVALVMIGFVVSWLFVSSSLMLAAILFVVTLALSILLVRYNMTHLSNNEVFMGNEE